MQHVIYPYLLEQIWVFDHQGTGLKAEPFVSGSSEALSALVEAKGIPNARSGFSLTFSDEPFDNFDAELNWVGSDELEANMPGNTYRGEIGGESFEGWLCPALLLFFVTPPQSIFVKVAPLPEDVDPIWHVADDDPRQRRFMSGDQK